MLGSYPYSGALFGSSLALNIRLGWKLQWQEPTNLQRYGIDYDRKKFYDIFPWQQQMLRSLKSNAKFKTALA
jgi:hypothetical protein